MLIGIMSIIVFLGLVAMAAIVKGLIDKLKTVRLSAIQDDAFMALLICDEVPLVSSIERIYTDVEVICYSPLT